MICLSFRGIFGGWQGCSSVRQELRQELLEVQGGIRVVAVQDEGPEAALHHGDRRARIGRLDLVQASGIEMDGAAGLEDRLLAPDQRPGAIEPVLGVLASLEAL